MLSNFYPRPPRGGRPDSSQSALIKPIISIHALREEGDVALDHALAGAIQFLSTPSARRATSPWRGTFTPAGFLSTPSARRATRLLGRYQSAGIDFYPRPPRGGRRPAKPQHQYRRNFYPRPPRGGRHFCQLLFGALHPISIHALREEGDASPGSGQRSCSDFYPRPPRGGRPALVQ